MKQARRWWWIVAAALLFGPAVPSAHAKFSAEEIRIGTETAKEIEKGSKLVTDEAILKRVNEIGQEIVRVSPDPTEKYVFKVIEDKDINAFALPGGFVYIYTGLLNAVESDDELAGVIAHEISHAALHHGLKLTKRQKPWDIAQMAVVLAGALANKDTSSGAYALSVLNTAKLNGYTVELEKEADAAGLKMITQSKYNPVGMLTFMERLDRSESRTGASVVELGIFRTHPYTPDRARARRAGLNNAKIEINRRLTTRSIQAIAESVKIRDVEAAVVKIDGGVFVTLAPSEGAPALERARSVAEAVNRSLLANLRFQEVTASAAAPVIQGRGITLAELTDADAALVNKTPADAARSAASQLKDTLWREYLRTHS